MSMTENREAVRDLILGALSQVRLAGRYSIDTDGEGFPVVLGRGGSSVVVKGQQLITETVTVSRAIKLFVYRQDIADRLGLSSEVPVSNQNFLEEITNLSALNHQNVLKVVDGGEFTPDGMNSEPVPFLVTELILGPSLREFEWDDEASASQEDRAAKVVGLLRDLLEGVVHLHERKFYHADIAPKNIFVQRDGGKVRAVVGDLGAGRTISEDWITGRGKVRVIGSKDYVPLEVRELLDKEIGRQQYSKLQPGWDVYSLCKTADAVLSRLIPTQNGGKDRPWLTAVRRMFKDGIDHPDVTSVSSLLVRLELLTPSQYQTWGIPELLSSDETFSFLLAVDSPLITRRIKGLVEHPGVRRLKGVPQLTMVSRRPAGGSHTRLEHSLGTYEMVRRMLNSLLKEPEFIRRFTPDEVELCLVYGLLSSVTRFPLSSIVHELRLRDENFLPSLSRKNVWDAIEQIGTEPLSVRVEKNFPKIDIDLLVKLLTSRSSAINGFQEGIIHSLLNSTMDARVLDFLRRDAVHLGISTGNPFDIGELLDSLGIDRDGLYIRVSGVSQVEQVVTYRYSMFNRFYWNRPNRGLAAMVSRVFSCLGDTLEENMSDFLQKVTTGTEEDVLVYLNSLTKSSNRKDLMEITHNLLYSDDWSLRELFHFAGVSGGLRDRSIRDWFKRLSIDELNNLHVDLGDLASRVVPNVPSDDVGIILDMPFEKDKTKLGEDVRVKLHDGISTTLTDYSPIAKGAQEGFSDHLQRLRVFASPILLKRAEESSKLEELRRTIEDYLRGRAGETH